MKSRTKPAIPISRDWQGYNIDVCPQCGNMKLRKAENGKTKEYGKAMPKEVLGKIYQLNAMLIQRINIQKMILEAERK